MARPTLTRDQIARLRCGAEDAEKAGLYRLATRLLTLADEGECGVVTRARIQSEIRGLHEVAERTDYILTAVVLGFQEKEARNA